MSVLLCLWWHKELGHQHTCYYNFCIWIILGYNGDAICSQMYKWCQLDNSKSTGQIVFKFGIHIGSDRVWIDQTFNAIIQMVLFHSKKKIGYNQYIIIAVLHPNFMNLSLHFTYKRLVVSLIYYWWVPLLDCTGKHIFTVVSTAITMIRQGYTLNSQMTPYSLPSQVSYGVSVWSIREKTNPWCNGWW